jgi:signal peptidase I
VIPVQKQTLVRYLFWALWFLVVPAAFAIGIVLWSEHAEGSMSQIAATVRDQRVPAGIVLFTLAEMTLYYFRHYLPYADPMGASAPSGLSRDQRREYEAAVHLLDEAHRLLDRHEKAIMRQVSATGRGLVTESLAALKAAIDREPFESERLRTAFAKANTQVDQHLATWRKSEAREYIESIGVAVLIALALRAVVVEAFKIPSGSMLPTLQIDDHIFVNKFIYGPTLPLTNMRVAENLPPNRGDVIVFEFPDPDPGQVGDDFIKRVIALPGDTLEVEKGHPVINGWRVPSCLVGKYPYAENDGNSTPHGDLFVEFLGDMAYLTVYEHRHLAGNEGPFEIGPNEVYVMGDNRHNSHDSRRWRNGAGAGVPFGNIRGRAMSVWLPLSRLFVPVMGEPVLPKRVPDELKAGVERCIAERPAQTTPPSPSAR